MAYLDIKGQRFGKLVAIDRVGNRPGYHQAVWLFRCDCGTEKTSFGYNVVHNGVTSCGCARTDKEPHLIHGMSHTPEHNTWLGMKKRCQNKNSKAFKDYGGRGIDVCPQWEDFKTFYRDMGDRPEGTTLERKNNDLGYSKANCIWATRKEQVRNRRTTTFYEHNGVTLSLQGWAETAGISYKLIWARYKSGKRGDVLLSSKVRLGGRTKRVQPLSDAPNPA